MTNVRHRAVSPNLSSNCRDKMRQHPVTRAVGDKNVFFGFRFVNEESVSTMMLGFQVDDSHVC
jgi:poly-beta-hydroxyalkanoate depolymerase